MIIADWFMLTLLNRFYVLSDVFGYIRTGLKKLILVNIY